MGMTNTQGDYWTSTQWANRNMELDRELAELTENGKLLADYMEEMGRGDLYFEGIHPIWDSHLYIPILADQLMDLDDWYINFSKEALEVMDMAWNTELQRRIMGKTMGFEELQRFFEGYHYHINIMEIILIWGILYIGE